MRLALGFTFPNCKIKLAELISNAKFLTLVKT